MSKPGVLIVTEDFQEGQYLCRLLAAMDHPAKVIPSVDNLQSLLEEEPNVVVLLDLDTVPPDKQFFRTLRQSQPRLHTLGISSLAYHPGLEEVIASLYACLVKPLDTDELRYWLKTISDNMAETENSLERKVNL